MKYIYLILLVFVVGCREKITPDNPKDPNASKQKITVGLDFSQASKSVGVLSRSASADTIRFRLTYEIRQADSLIVRGNTLFNVAQSRFELVDSLQSGTYKLAVFGDYVVVKDDKICREHFTIDSVDGLHSVRVTRPETDEQWKMAYSGNTELEVKAVAFGVSLAIERCITKISFDRHSRGYPELNDVQYANYKLTNFSTLYDVFSAQGMADAKNPTIEISNCLVRDDRAKLHEVTVFETVAPFELECIYINKNGSVIEFPIASSDMTRDDLPGEIIYRNFIKNKRYSLSVQHQSYVFGDDKLRLFGMYNEDIYGDQWVFEPKQSSSVLPSDSLALVDFFNSLGGNEWTQSWHMYLPIANWTGIKLKKIDGVDRVVGICLADTSLYASSRIGNNINGSIPQSIKNLSELREFRLEANLKTADMDLGEFKKLNIFHLHNATSVNGFLPDKRYPNVRIGTSTSLKEFKCENVTIDDFNSIVNNTDLEIIELWWPILNFTVDEPIMTGSQGMTKLKYFDTYFVTINNSYKYLSDDFYTLSQLESVVVDLDFDIVKASHSMLKLTRLQVFYQTPQPLVKEIGMFKMLKSVTFHNIKGAIPKEFYGLLSLENFMFQSSDLKCEISPDIGYLVNVYYFHMSNCNLVGEIPVEIGKLSKLQFARLENNNLTGSIPQELASIPYLQEFTLRGNKLSGDIPLLLLYHKYWGNLSRKFNPQQPGFGFDNFKE